MERVYSSLIEQRAASFGPQCQAGFSAPPRSLAASEAGEGWALLLLRLGVLPGALDEGVKLGAVEIL